VTPTADEFIAKKNADFAKKPVIKMKDIGRKGNHYWYREAWTFLVQSNNPKKVYVIERLRKESIDGTIAYGHWKDDDKAYRLGYYIVGKIGRTNGRWVWGQFCPLVLAQDLLPLLEKAKAEGSDRGIASATNHAARWAYNVGSARPSPPPALLKGPAVMKKRQKQRQISGKEWEALSKSERARLSKKERGPKHAQQRETYRSGTPQPDRTDRVRSVTSGGLPGGGKRKRA
jgi:hypothetical protein